VSSGIGEHSGAVDWLWVLFVAVRGLSPAPADQWATTLAKLDQARTDAFATADPARLGEVYMPGSAGLRADAAAIEAYGRRGGRVVDADLHILSCRVVRSSPDRVRLDIVDQLGGARVVWADGTSTDLPRDRPSRRLVTIERSADGWRVAASRQVTTP
jgi:hypothetical protein